MRTKHVRVGMIFTSGSFNYRIVDIKNTEAMYIETSNADKSYLTRGSLHLETILDFNWSKINTGTKTCQ